MTSRSAEQITELINAMMEDNRMREHRIRSEAKEREARIFLMNASVSPYSGSSNPENVKEFTDAITRISVGFNLNDEQLKIVAGRNMTGAAERWYKQYTKKEENKEDTFEEFHKKILQYFTKQHDSQEQIEKFEALKQTGKIDEFNLHFLLSLEVFSGESMKEETKLNWYLTKLKMNLRTEVKCRDPKNLDDAMRIALLIDKRDCENLYRSSFARNQRKYYRPQSNKTSQTRSNGYQLTTNEDQMEIDSVNIKQKKKIKCYNCSKEGHFASNCTDRSKN